MWRSSVSMAHVSLLKEGNYRPVALGNIPNYGLLNSFYTYILICGMYNIFVIKSRIAINRLFETGCSTNPLISGFTFRCDGVVDCPGSLREDESEDCVAEAIQASCKDWKLDGETATGKYLINPGRKGKSCNIPFI